MEQAAPIDLDSVDFVAFTTLSSVQAFAQATEGKRPTGVRAVCIGERTAAAARALGMDAVQLAEMTLESMAARLEALCVGE